MTPMDPHEPTTLLTTTQRLNSMRSQRNDWHAEARRCRRALERIASIVQDPEAFDAQKVAWIVSVVDGVLEGRRA